MSEALLYDKVLGSLASACIGDALGAPTEQRSITEIRKIWGGRVETFQAPPQDAPYSVGRKAGQITDDASQMLHLVDAYVEGQGELTPELVAAHLVRWASDGQYFPRFAGPTTRVAIERLREGVPPSEVGKTGRLTTEGTSNGAGMRVAPAGFMHPGDLEAAVQDALVTCIPTHATNLAISGASCVAAAVAAAMVPAASLLDVVRAARWGAIRGDELGREYGREVAGPSVVRRLDLALELAVRADDFDQAVWDIATTVGTGLHISEAVPSALSIFFAAGGDPFLAAVGGANAGDDTDTVACIAAGIAGAYSGFAAVPTELYRQVLEANGLDLASKAAHAVAVIQARVKGA